MARLSGRINTNGAYTKKTGMVKGDARLKIIASKRSHLTDARDKLASLARGMDARQKLEKIRNLKQGKLDVKTTANGNITIVTQTNGKLQLTTKRKTAGKQTQKMANSGKAKELIKKNLPHTTRQNFSATAARRSQPVYQQRPVPSRAHIGSLAQQRARSSGMRSDDRLTRTILSESARLDEELMSTRVDPWVLRKSGRQNPVKSRQPPMRIDNRPPIYTRNRSSPEEMDYEDYSTRPLPPSFTTVPPTSRASRYDYDDIHREQFKEDDAYRRKLHREEIAVTEHQPSTTKADRFSETGGSFSSPLQGTKIVISNLQPTVTQEDILELFGDVGALKRAKLNANGVAEVVYVNKADAVKAVDVYHNRQLDGKPMKCQIVGAAATYESRLPSLPRSSEGHHSLTPDMSAIHKALFLDGKKQTVPTSARPHFTVTMSTKNIDRY